MPTRVRIFAGACGFTSVVKARRLDKNHVEVKIISACKMLRKMNDDLDVIDWRRNLFNNIRDSLVYISADKHLMHTDCPVPSAIIKVIQIELNGMLPMDVSMTFDREEDVDEEL